MKSTGVIKRIDEYGRVSIPKEVRRQLNIKDGDELEIFVLKNGGIALVPLETEEDREKTELIASAILSIRNSDSEEVGATVEDVLKWAKEFYKKSK